MVSLVRHIFFTGPTGPVEGRARALGNCTKFCGLGRLSDLVSGHRFTVSAFEVELAFVFGPGIWHYGGCFFLVGILSPQNPMEMVLFFSRGI